MCAAAAVSKLHLNNCQKFSEYLKRVNTKYNIWSLKEVCKVHFLRSIKYIFEVYQDHFRGIWGPFLRLKGSFLRSKRVIFNTSSDQFFSNFNIKVKQNLKIGALWPSGQVRENLLSTIIFEHTDFRQFDNKLVVK